MQQKGPNLNCYLPNISIDGQGTMENPAMKLQLFRFNRLHENNKAGKSKPETRLKSKVFSLGRLCV